jgi:hypothetical protein
VWVRARLCELQKKGCTRLAAASDKDYMLLAHGRWFSPGTPSSSTTKTLCHDIAEILLKVALSTKNQSILRLSILQNLINDKIVFCVVFCRSYFVLFLLAIVLSVLLRFTSFLLFKCKFTSLKFKPV